MYVSPTFLPSPFFKNSGSTPETLEWECSQEDSAFYISCKQTSLDVRSCENEFLFLCAGSNISGRFLTLQSEIIITNWYKIQYCLTEFELICYDQNIWLFFFYIIMLYWIKEYFVTTLIRFKRVKSYLKLWIILDHQLNGTCQKLVLHLTWQSLLP